MASTRAGKRILLANRKVSRRGFLFAPHPSHPLEWSKTGHVFTVGDSGVSQTGSPRGPLDCMVIDVLLVIAALGFALAQSLGRQPESGLEPSARRGPLMQLNLDDATANELGLLPQIGPKMAERIIRFRSSRPGIGSWEELESISGMGPSTIRTIRPWCTIAPLTEDLASNH